LKKGSDLLPLGTGTLARMPLGASAPREILEDVVTADWAPNGEDLAVIRQTPEGKHRLEYPIGHVLQESFSINWIRVSPSGSLVAYVEDGSDGRTTIGVVDAKGGKRTLTAGWSHVRGPVWSRSGGEILFVAGRGVADAAVRAVSLSGRERVLFWLAGGSLTLHDVAADGRLLIERATSRSGISCLVIGEIRERELGWLDRSELLDLSDDGRTVLFADGGEGGGVRGAVFLRKTDGSPAVRLGDGDPQAISPDGKWALSLTLTDPPELELLPTGPGSPKKVPVDGIKPLAGRFLPDGRIAVFHSAPGEPPRLSVVGVEGGRPMSVVVPGVNAAGGIAFSRDSKLVAYATRERQVRAVPIAGGPPRAVAGPPLEHGERVFQWSADERFLFTVKTDDIPARIWRLDLDTGSKTLWKEIRPADTSGIVGLFGVRMTPDGRSYAYSYVRIDSSDLYVAEGLK